MFWPLCLGKPNTVDKNGPAVQGGLDGGEDGHRCDSASSKSVHLGLAPITEVPASLTVTGPKDSGHQASLGVMEAH